MRRVSQCIAVCGDQNRGDDCVVRLNEGLSYGDVPGRANRERVGWHGVRAPAVCAPAIKRHVLLRCK